jgi:hypothetical protein
MDVGRMTVGTNRKGLGPRSGQIGILFLSDGWVIGEGDGNTRCQRMM